MVKKALHFHQEYVCEIILETLSDVQKLPIINMCKNITAIYLYTNDYYTKMSDFDSSLPSFHL